MTARATIVVALILAAGGPGCGGDGPAPPSPPPGWAAAADPGPHAPRFLVVVGGDYASTVVSFVALGAAATAADGDAPLVFSTALHSGSKVGGVATALSGDVVVARGAPAGHLAVLVDRATGVLTVIDPAVGAVVRQIAASPGFYGNPQDAIAADGNAFIVSRMGRHPAPADPAHAGDDLVWIGPAGVVRRVGLGGFATGPALVAAPQRIALAGGRVWAPLASFSPDFAAQGPARVVGAPVGAGPPAVVDLAGRTNCQTAVALPGGRIAVACTGTFAAPATQLAASAIAVIAVDGAVAQVEAEFAADPALGPWGRDFAAAGSGRLFAVALGDLKSGRGDALVAIHPQTGERRVVATAAKAYALSGLWWDPGRSLLWLGDRSRAGADLRRFAVGPDGAAVERPAVASNPGGLAVIDLGGT